MSPPQPNHPISQPQWTGHPRIKGKHESTQMALLTAASIGVQFGWGAEMTYAAPYLLSLGLSKSHLALVWLAGPLSGLIMQPVIGTVSDRCHSRYGRRRPFMLVGSVLVAVALVGLGWTSEVVGVFVSGETARTLTVCLAVADIFLLDFVLNIIQMTCAALVVDSLPVAKQQLGAAWASRMMGVGQLLIYGLCSLNLDAIFGNFLGDTQLKKICILAAFGTAATQALTCWAVTERVLLPDVRPGARRMHREIIGIVSQIYTKTRHVPERIQSICWVQFWSWVGWYTVGFYGSTWVGEIYLRYDAPSSALEGTNAVDEVGRHGSMSFVFYSIVSLTSAVVIPWLVQKPDEAGDGKDNDDDDDNYLTTHLRIPRKPALVRRFCWRKPSLLTTWCATNLLFAATMIWAPLVQSVNFATLLIAIVAIPRAVAAWAPAAFLGVEVTRLSSTSNALTNRRRRSRGSRRSIDSTSSANSMIELESHPNSSQPTSTPMTTTVLHIRHDSLDLSPLSTPSTGELSGIYLGILNIYTTLPQFVGTAISWVVFSLFEPGRSPELAPPELRPAEPAAGEGDGTGGGNAVSGIGVCLFVSALCAVGAAWATRRLRTGKAPRGGG